MNKISFKSKRYIRNLSNYTGISNKLVNICFPLLSNIANRDSIYFPMHTIAMVTTCTMIFLRDSGIKRFQLKERIIFSLMVTYTFVHLTYQFLLNVSWCNLSSARCNSQPLAVFNVIVILSQVYFHHSYFRYWPYCTLLHMATDNYCKSK